MKKFKSLAILAAILLMHTSSYAIGIDYGVEFGISQANFKLKDSGVDLNNELGYGVGVSAKVDLPLVNIGPELWYYRNTATTSDDGKIKSNSFDLPIVVSYSIAGPVAIELGPSFSLSSSGKYKDDNSTFDLGRIRPEVGYVVGARVTLFDVLMVSARFNGCFSKYGVKYIDNNTYKMRYNAWSINVGAKF